MSKGLRLALVIALGGAASLAGCLGADDETEYFTVDYAGPCVPGAQAACACPGGVGGGVQICLPDGSGYGECVCPPPAAGGSGGVDPGTGGAGGSGPIGTCTVFPDCGGCVECFETCVCQSEGHVSECLQTCGGGTGGTGGSGGGSCNPADCPPPAFPQAGEVCCTPDEICGIRITALGQACVPRDQPGVVSDQCPDQQLMGITVQGCCRPDGKCGYMDTFLGLGCVDPSVFGQPSGNCNP